MIKDQASALREMIRLKKEHKKQEEMKQGMTQTAKASSSDSELVSSDALIQPTEFQTIPLDEGKLSVDSSFEGEVTPCEVKTDDFIPLTSMKSSIGKEENNPLSNDIFAIDQLELMNKEIEIMAICSGKDGVGRSHFSLNTAITLQQQGKNVLIIDLNLGQSNIEALCGVEIPYSLEDVICERKNINDVTVVGPQGIRFVAGGSGWFETKEWDEDSRQIFQEQLSELKDIDVILIDVGAGVSKSSILYTMFAQELILIVTPEPTSVTDAYSFLRIIDQYRLKKEIQVVVNRTKDEDEAKKTFDLLYVTVQKFLTLDLKFAGFIHDDGIVIDSIKMKKPLVLTASSSLAAQDIRNISKRIIEFETNKRKPQTMKEVANRFLHVFG